MHVCMYIDTKVQALVKLVRGAQQKMCFQLAVEYNIFRLSIPMEREESWFLWRVEFCVDIIVP